MTVLPVIPVEGVLAHNPHPLEMVWDGMEDSRSVLQMVESTAPQRRRARHSAFGGLAGRVYDRRAGDCQRRPKRAGKAKPVVCPHWRARRFARLLDCLAGRERHYQPQRPSRLHWRPSRRTLTIPAALEKMGVKVEVFKNKGRRLQGRWRDGHQLER